MKWVRGTADDSEPAPSSRSFFPFPTRSDHRRIANTCRREPTAECSCCTPHLDHTLCPLRILKRTGPVRSPATSLIYDSFEHSTRIVRKFRSCGPRQFVYRNRFQRGRWIPHSCGLHGMDRLYRLCRSRNAGLDCGSEIDNRYNQSPSHTRDARQTGIST